MSMSTFYHGLRMILKITTMSTPNLLSMIMSQVTIFPRELTQDQIKHFMHYIIGRRIKIFVQPLQIILKLK